MKQQTVSVYGSGINSHDVKTIRKIAEFFDVSIDYLAGFSEIRNPAEKIAIAIADDEDLRLFWEDARKRKELKLLLKHIKDLQPE